MENRTLWILLVGDPGVGKTTFLNALKGEYAKDNLFSSFYNMKRYYVERGGVKTQVQVYDSKKTPPNLRTHYGGLDGIIFVYDIAKKDSLTNLTEWIKECGWYAPAGTIKMIVGNKSDRKQDRAFEKSAGKKFADQCDILHSVETSALTKKNVEEVLRMMVTHIMIRYYPGTPLAGLAKLSATAPTSLGNQGNPQPESGDNHAVPIQPSAWVLKASNADDNVSIDASPASTPKKSKQSSDRANPQPNEIGPPVEPPDSQFAKAEDPWKIVSQVLNDTISHAALLKSTGGDAQAVLNILQKLLDCQKTPENLRHYVFATIIEKITRTRFYPENQTIRGIRYEPGLIAHGTFGDTWKGSYGSYPVCLKVVRAQKAEEVQCFISDFAKESLTFSEIAHPNILPFYGVFNLEEPVGRIGIMTPWMENGTINKYLEINPDIPRLPLLYDILDGLSHLHTHSIIHGDLRGANVLITPTGTACLADFGLFSLKDNASLSQLGSQPTDHFRWKAPELMDELGDGQSPSPILASDVYSAGCVMYEVLTGQPPFHEVHREVIVVARVIQGTRPTKPSPQQYLEFSDEIWAIMKRSWAGSPSDRPTIHQLLASLRQVPTVALTASRLWKAMQGPKKDHMPLPLTPQAFRTAMRGQDDKLSKVEIQILREYLTPSSSSSSARS